VKLIGVTSSSKPVEVKRTQGCRKEKKKSTENFISSKNILQD
jgi:hypothetical protein